MAPVGQWAAQLPHFWFCEAGRQFCLIHTAWPIWMAVFSSLVMGRMAPVGQMLEQRVHSGLQYLSGRCMAVPQMSVPAQQELLIQVQELRIQYRTSCLLLILFRNLYSTYLFSFKLVFKELLYFCLHCFAMSIATDLRFWVFLRQF